MQTDSRKYRQDRDLPSLQQIRQVTERIFRNVAEDTWVLPVILTMPDNYQRRLFGVPGGAPESDDVIEAVLRPTLGIMSVREGAAIASKKAEEIWSNPAGKYAGKVPGAHVGSSPADVTAVIRHRHQASSATSCI